MLPLRARKLSTFDGAFPLSLEPISVLSFLRNLSIDLPQTGYKKKFWHGSLTGASFYPLAIVEKRGKGYMD
jgi:hypothetical protein